MSVRRTIATLFGAIVAAAAASAAADEGALALEDTLRALFQGSPAFQIYGAQTREAEGAHLRAAGAFDVVASAALTGQRQLLNNASGTPTSDGYADLSFRTGLATRTRQNIALQLSGSLPLVSTLDVASSPDQPQVGATLVLPLLKLGRAAGPGADERTAELHAEAATSSQRDGEADLAARVAESYWRWVGSYEQLKLVRRLEELALDQMHDVDQLIAQHARAAADRLPLVAAADNATAVRVQAEQFLFTQQQVLWETIGVVPPAARALPADTLPIVPAALPEAAELAERGRHLAASRPLFTALARESRAAAVRAEAARIGKRPDLDLVAQAMATRVEASSMTSAPNAASRASAAGAQAGLGYYGSLALQFSLPLQNRAARGALAQAEAAYAQLTLSLQQQRNAVALRIDALSSELVALSRTHQQRTRAAQQLQLAYEAERARFRLGTATAMTVVLAEQQYMSASLAAVGDRVAYAVTLTRLLRESGRLGAAVELRDAAAAARALMTSIP